MVPKVFEPLKFYCITEHLDKLGIMYDLQHGSRDTRSCVTQLIMMVDDLVRNVYAGKQTVVIFLEFSKAFNKINHSKLLWILHRCGISSKVPGWIRAFSQEQVPAA